MAGSNEYTVPFGIDPRKFFEGLNAMENGTEKTAAAVKTANQEMQKGFDTAASAGENLGKKLDTDAQKAQQLRDTARAMGKDVGDALSGKNVGQGLEDRIKKIQQTATATKSVPLGFDFDESKLQHLNDLIESGADEFKVLAQVVDFAKEKLATLDPNTAEWQQLNEQIQQADGLLQAFGHGEDNVGVKSKSLKAQLREMKAELSAMEMAGQEDTDKFLQLSIAAGKLEDQIGDTAKRVRVLASDTKYLDAGIQAVGALAGGFTAAQGAAALFGDQNEEAQKVIQKVTGAMAVLQGVQAVAVALNKDSALSVLLFSKAQTTATATTEALAGAEVVEAGATEVATVATKSWTAALLANPIFLIIAGVTALVAALYVFASGADDAKKANDDLNDTLERQNTLIGLDEGAINRRTSLLVAQTKAEGELAASKTKDVVKQAEIQAATEAKVASLEGQGLAQRINARIENLNETRKLLADKDYTEKLSAENFKKLQDTELKQSEDVENLKNELRIKGIDKQTQASKAQIDIEKKRIEETKKRAAEEKAILEQQIKFRDEFGKAFIDSILDQYEKEKQTAKLNTQNEIDQLRAQKSLSAKAEQEKNDLIALLETNLSDKLKDIDSRRLKDRATLLFQGQQQLADLQAEGTAKEIQVLQLSYQQKAKEIKEQFKNEGNLRNQLLKALAAKEAIEVKQIRDKAAQDNLTNEEERAALEVEISAQFLGNLPHIEEEKQIAILKVKEDFAVRRLNLLRLQGKAEDSLEVLNAKKALEDIQKELGDAAAKLASEQNKFSFFKLLGLDDLSDKQKTAVIDAAKKSLESVATITDAIVSNYQRQIDKKKEAIAQDDKAIDDLQNQLDKEKQLRDEGLANNVAGIQAELDAKKNQRAQDLKDQEELQKKQQAIQKAQFALDTASQASNLITASTEIFKALAGIPFIGVPLAITTVGLMIGAFVAAKLKALQAINEGQNQKFEAGGWIEGGKKHSQGGKKFRAIDGSGDVKELESGEHVTRASQAAKYADLLDAINNDELHGMSEDGIREMLRAMGIHLTQDEPAEALQIVKEREVFTREFSAGVDISEDVKGIRRRIDMQAEAERLAPKHWSDGVFNYTKIGNKTTKTPI